MYTPLACYHLIGAASPADERSSIGARALTGERYRGHVFWDTEIFAWPPSRPKPRARSSAVTTRPRGPPRCSATGPASGSSA